MRDKRLPSAQEALKLLIQSGCSQDVIEHCKKVAKQAVEIAKLVKERGNVDVNLVKIGAILHDIGRSRTHRVDHAIVGAEIAMSLGLPDPLISIIERHVGGGITMQEAKRLGWPIKSYLPQTKEEKIVAYADKLIEGKRRVPIDLTLEKFSRELGKRHPAIDRVRKLHSEISHLIGKDVAI